ncbi:hypothetical protein HDZ31DRAFT_47629 [Schizophyllum fasciatum]
MPPKKKKKAQPRSAPAGDSNTDLTLTKTKRTAKKKSKSSPDPASDEDYEDDQQTSAVKDARTPRTKARDAWVDAEKNNKTPLANTRASRSAKLRRKVFALIGRVACLVTGMSFDPHFLHVAHIIARSLSWTHWWLYDALLRDIGIPIYDKKGRLIKKVLNLDTSVNQEILVSWIHLLFDGTSVRTNLGRGVIAFVPENLDEILALIKANKESKEKKSYRELCPNATYRYKLRCFSQEEYFFGTYENARRTYDHLSTDQQPTAQQKEQEDRELDKEHPMPDDGEHGADHASSVVNPEEVPETAEAFLSGRCRAGTLTLGDQPGVFISPMNPILATHNLVSKMRYRMANKRLHDFFPQEWISHYKSVMKPATDHWYPTEEEAIARRKAEKRSKAKGGRPTYNSNRDEDANSATQSHEEAPVPPSTRPHPEDVPQPTAALHAAHSSSPPLEPSGSSPLGGGATRSSDGPSDLFPLREKIPRLDVEAAMATRDSSPPAPDEPTPKTSARAPQLIRPLNDPVRETGMVCAGDAQSLPDLVRRTKTLPKRLVKSGATGTAAALEAGRSITAAKDPPNSPQDLRPEQQVEADNADLRLAKPPDTHLNTAHSTESVHALPPPVPKAPDKADPPAAASTSEPPTAATSSSTLPVDPHDPPNAYPRASKAPDKVNETLGPSGPSAAPSPGLGGQPPGGGRVTRSSTKRNRAEANEAVEPKPPDPPNRFEPASKKRRTKGKERAEEPNIERDHDPPEPSSRARRARKR